ncbi:MAG: zinc-binding dehydrogenase, partial [Chloroflexota bacterium]|nr:zinc-binding dehydrogenase [Chloroflexota bacterium]
LARSLGAHEFINYRTENLTERVKALTDGKGADVILEPVGGDIYHQSEQALASFGRLVVFGAASGQPGQIDPLRLMRRNASVVGFWMATLPGRMIAEGMGAMAGWLAQGELRIISGGVYPLAEAAQAQRDLEARRTRGKLALVMAR